MLENDNGTTPAETTPQPPARRRAASRPAGPPPEVAAPSQVPHTAAAQPDTASGEAAPGEESQKPTRSRRATRPTGAVAETAVAAPAKSRSRAKAAPTPDPEDATADGQAPAEKPKRSRRTAASAVAAPAAGAEDAPAVGEKPATRRRASRPVAAPEASAVEDAPATESAAAEPAAAPAEDKPATRGRRASRPAAAPEVTTETAAPAADISESTPVAEEVASEADKPATRRRRATRSAAAAESKQQDAAAADQTTDVGAALDALSAEIAAGKSDAAAEEKPTRRRRATRPVAPAPAGESVVEEASEEDEMDGIAAALRMAEDAARSRRALVADPFSVPEETRQARLDELAGAIASGDEDSDEDDDEDSDEDDSDDDDSDDEDSDDDSDDEDSDDEDSDDDSDEPDAEESQDSERGNRRRRRRGGRRRRRGGNRDDSSDSSDDATDKAPDTDADEAGDDHATHTPDHDSDHDSDSHDTEGDSDHGDASGSGTTRRRRRRRRSGNDNHDSSSSSSSKGTGEDAITGIEGSTRMEAKRQRRRDNRAAGRRRAPILSEAEFLARREAVDRKLVIRQSDDYTQLAVVEDGILVEHYVDRASATSLIGNVYIGKVQNVLPSMEAAFIDIGRGRNAVLYAGEVDWNSYHVSSEDRKVEKVFKSGQAVLVQVTKDPVGAKGARLTGHISLPGRYVVYSPGGHLSGISRKLPDAERARLREILGEVISDQESVIVRTAAEGASSEELVRDVNRLKSQWEIIEKKVKQGGAPVSLYSEPDLTLRIVRDLFTEDFGALVVQGNGGPDDSFDAISAYVGHVAPHLADRLQRFEPDDTGHDAFAEYRIDEQIAKALDRKVFLPSGGSLIIDRTEAMTVIDVNTGRFTGSGGNLEATVTSNNLEAAEEVVRQLRLRDIGGIIVVDFIDMVLPSNRELLLRRLVECLARDRTRHQVAEVTSLGLVQLTRKKIGTGLAEAFTEECDHCHGAGYLRFDEPVDSQSPSDGGDRRSHGGGNGGGGGANRNRGGRGRRGGNAHHGGGNGGEKKSE